jgi:hypothetical protein
VKTIMPDFDGSIPVVRIFRNWDWPDLSRQLPNGQDIWDGVRFIIDQPGECDYCVVLNKPIQDVEITCPPDHVWSILQEPPIPSWKPYHRGHPLVARTITTDPTVQGPKFIHTQPGLAWHVNRSYDELIECPVPLKKEDLSFITSASRALPGHRARLDFLDTITGQIEFDLYGKGFTRLDDKWDGLAPYRYSIAIENFSCPDYWTEKLADCYLAWCMPIYFGCTNISTYFPPESMIQIDLQDPDSPVQIREAIRRNDWEKNLDAIEEARNRILHQYQIFPLIVDQIQNHQQRCAHLSAEPIVLPEFLRPQLSLKERIDRDIMSVRRKLTLGTKIRRILHIRKSI